MPAPLTASPKLLWLTEQYPPSEGGMARSCDRIADSLRRMGAEVDLIHFVAGGGPMAGSLGFSWNPRRGGRDMLCPMGDDRSHTLNALYQFLSAAPGPGYDWVVAFGAQLPLVAGPLFAAWLNAKFGVLLRGNDFDAGIFSSRKRAALLEALEKADAVCAVSRDKADKVRALFPFQSVIHTPNGIDLGSWRLFPSQSAWAEEWRAKRANGRVVIGMVGQLKAKKGALFFLECLRRSTARERVHLLIVGDADPALASWLLRFRRKVSHDFIPFAPRGELPRYFAACDFAAIPSFYDGMPNTLLEAGALGVPLLAANAGGMADVLRDGENAVLFTPGDAVACDLAIDRALRLSEGDRRALGMALRDEIVSHFSAEIEGQRYFDIFSQSETTTHTESCTSHPAPLPRRSLA